MSSDKVIGPECESKYVKKEGTHSCSNFLFGILIGAASGPGLMLWLGVIGLFVSMKKDRKGGELMKKQERSPPQEFDEISEKSPSLAKEFVQFAREHKKLWMIPMIVILLLIGLLIVAGSSSMAPFIYTLF